MHQLEGYDGKITWFSIQFSSQSKWDWNAQIKLEYLVVMWHLVYFRCNLAAIEMHQWGKNIA